MAPQPPADERQARLARSWDEAADGYEAYFVPRFAPWVAAGVAALSSSALPDGPILVSCCGTLPELAALTQYLPSREIVGIDISPGMVRLATARAAAWPNVTAVVGDAARLDQEWPGTCAGMVSVFGLQQLPEPDVALRSWLGTLRPGGRLSFVYWPEITEPVGPFALLSEITAKRAQPHGDAWEDRLIPALTSAGATVVRDESIAFPMSYGSAAEFFDAFARHGPMRATANARGAAYIAELRERFLRLAPSGEWRHSPAARLIVAIRGESGLGADDLLA